MTSNRKRPYRQRGGCMAERMFRLAKASGMSDAQAREWVRGTFRHWNR